MQEILYAGTIPIATGKKDIIDAILLIVDDDCSVKAGDSGVYINGTYYYVSCDDDCKEMNYWFRNNGYEQYTIQDEYYACEPEFGYADETDIDQIMQLDMLEAKEKGFVLSQTQIKNLKLYYQNNLNKSCYIKAVYVNDRIVAMHKYETFKNQPFPRITVYVMPELRESSLKAEILDIFVTHREWDMQNLCVANI